MWSRAAGRARPTSPSAPKGAKRANSSSRTSPRRACGARPRDAPAAVGVGRHVARGRATARTWPGAAAATRRRRPRPARPARPSRSRAGRRDRAVERGGAARPDGGAREDRRPARPGCPPARCQRAGRAAPGPVLALRLAGGPCRPPGPVAPARGDGRARPGRRRGPRHRPRPRTAPTGAGRPTASSSVRGPCPSSRQKRRPGVARSAAGRAPSARASPRRGGARVGDEVEGGEGHEMEYVDGDLVGYLLGSMPVALLVARATGSTCSARATATRARGTRSSSSARGALAGLRRRRRPRRSRRERSGSLLGGWWTGWAAVAAPWSATRSRVLARAAGRQGGHVLRRRRLRAVAARRGRVPARSGVRVTAGPAFAWGARAGVFAFPLVQLVTDPVEHVRARAGS